MTKITNSTTNSIEFKKPSFEKFVAKPLEKPKPPQNQKKQFQNLPQLDSIVTVIPYKSLLRAGSYNLGPEQASSPVKCIKQYLGRKGDKFYTIKILTLSEEKDTTDDVQGKTLIHTEHSLLSLEKDNENIIGCVELFRETVVSTFLNKDTQKMEERPLKRICLVLDCQTGHDYSPSYTTLTNMQRYVIEKKKLTQSEAMTIFFKVAKIVLSLHTNNIVHRDIKLGNIIYDTKLKTVKLSNFCLGKHLSSENDLLKDQRGSPAYISPDVISGKPYLGKPSDMWALGVTLYTMLFGQFPFYDASPTELFRKIKSGVFTIPTDINVDLKIEKLIQNLLILDPSLRLTAAKTVKEAESIIFDQISLMEEGGLLSQLL